MSDPALRVMSVEEYLRTEQESPVKREYVAGFVYPLHAEEGTRAQAGASRSHVTITGNILYALVPATRREGCRLYASNMRLRLASLNTFFYPDVMVACGSDGDEFYETSPCLLVKVLSPSTAAMDRQAKYVAYTSIPTLQTYLIVSQTERHILAYQRRGDTWELGEYSAAGAISLPCPEHTLTLDEVYAGVFGA